jgi:plasmid stabilization system protein ParE
MSPRPFRFHPAAQSEARESARWYRDRSRQAAANFRAAVTNAVRTIVQSPERWTKYLYGTRRFIMDTFPFSIIYLDDSDEIEIVAVAHHKRRPGYWKDRI